MATQTSIRTVTLYEDNAGHLFLHRQGDDVYYADLEQVRGAAFGADAAELAAGNTTDWTLRTFPVSGDMAAHPDWFAPQADYDERGVMLVEGGQYAGYAARLYLGLAAQ